jgi:hypothetical protein
MRRNYPSTYHGHAPEAVANQGALAVAQAKTRARALDRLSFPTAPRISISVDESGRKRILPDAPTVDRSHVHADAGAIGNRDAGAHDLRAHDLRRAAARNRANRKRVNDVRKAFAHAGTDLASLSRADARFCFYIGMANRDADYAAQAAGAWIWISAAGRDRRETSYAIVECAVKVSREDDGIGFVRDFARALAPLSVDREIIGDLYALAIEARAIRSGIAAPSQLVTNGKRVGGTANQRVWDTRPWDRRPASKGKATSPSAVSVPAEKSESLSTVVWEHARNGDPTVSLGTDRANDAARIVRAILAHLPEGLAFSDLAVDCNAAAWSIAVGAVKYAVGESNPSLVHRVKGLARQAARLRKTAPDSLARKMLGTVARTSRIVRREVSASHDPNVLARCRGRDSAMRAFTLAKASGQRPIIRTDQNGDYLVIATVGARAAHTASFGSLSGGPSELAS